MDARLSVLWEGMLNTVTRFIDEWQPPANHTRERDLHVSLEEFLRLRMPKAHVEREYRHVGTTTDLYVRQSVVADFEAFIEVKRNLKSKTECDRLLGQLQALDPRTRNVVLVFVGKTKPELIQRVREHYRREFLTTYQLRIVERP